jgi:hypothetical protein
LLSRVSPFRNLRIKDHLHLPAAYRSLLRLSSALSAKASTLRSCLLTIYVSGLRSPLTRVCSVIPPAVLDLFISIWCVNTFFTPPSALTCVHASGFVCFSFKVYGLCFKTISSDVLSLLFKIFYMWFSRCKNLIPAIPSFEVIVRWR